jgi:hypothetical protein
MNCTRSVNSDNGKANTENKYDFPPPIDNILYFGCIALVAKNDKDDYVDLSLEEWNNFYEDLFGGFENLADTAKEDDNEIDELENIPAEMKTKTGYLKDDFVVEDNMVENVSGSNSGDEGTWEDDSTAELEFDEYYYSDED